MNLKTNNKHKEKLSVGVATTHYNISPLKYYDAKCVFVIIIIVIAVRGRFATDYYYYYYYYHRIGEQNVSLTTRYENQIKLAGSCLLKNIEQCCT